MNGSTREIAWQAMQRAALLGKSGSRSQRSGVIDDFLEHQKLAKRITSIAKAATLAWFNWLAMNETAGRADVYGMSGQITDNFEFMRYSFLRAATLDAYRISDPPGADRETLCSVARLLSDPTIRNIVLPQWLIDHGDADDMNNKIDSFLRVVSPDWKLSPPKGRKLLDLRLQFKPIRDRAIAHAIDTSLLKHPRIHEINELVSLSLKLALAAQELFGVASRETQNDIENSLRQTANVFWSRFLPSDGTAQ